MPSYIERTLANIEKKPNSYDDINDTQLTIGDLHGNTLKLLYILVRHALIDLSTEQYDEIVRIYKTPTELMTQELIARFNFIIDKIVIRKQTLLIRLIGDETADRGQNDYYTLKLIQKLIRSNIKLVIIISNHAFDFISTYERYIAMNKTLPPHLHPGFANSLINLKKFIDQGLISEGEFLDLANNYYKPCLKLIDYSVDFNSNTLTLFSHAIIGLDLVNSICSFMGVPYMDDSIHNLIRTLDILHEVFKTHISNNSIYTLINPWYPGTPPVDLLRYNPLVYLMFNRNFVSTGDHLFRPCIHNLIKLFFVHGHDFTEPTELNIINLDRFNIVGKTVNDSFGLYSYLRSDDPVFSCALRSVKAEEPQSKYKEISLSILGLVGSGIFYKVFFEETITNLTIGTIAGAFTLSMINVFLSYIRNDNRVIVPEEITLDPLPSSSLTSENPIHYTSPLVLLRNPEREEERDLLAWEAPTFVPSSRGL